MRKKEKITPERVAQIAEWKRSNTWRLCLEINNALRLKERMEAAISDGAAPSKQGYAVMAITEKLDKEGY